MIIFNVYKNIKTHNVLVSKVLIQMQTKDDFIEKHIN